MQFGCVLPSTKLPSAGEDAARGLVEKEDLFGSTLADHCRNAYSSYESCVELEVSAEGKNKSYKFGGLADLL